MIDFYTLYDDTSTHLYVPYNYDEGSNKIHYFVLDKRNVTNHWTPMNAYYNESLWFPFRQYSLNIMDNDRMHKLIERILSVR